MDSAEISMKQKDLNILGLSAYAVDEDFIKCPMCLERYTRPKLLKCLHTLCEHCITVHIQHAARNKQVTHKEFPCPKCHAMTNVIKPELPLDKWAETLPANTMMGALLESISLQVDDKLCGTCEEGGDSTIASYWCRDCAEPLCDNCLKYHRLMKISRRHKIEEMDIIKRHPKRILSVPQPCPDHVGKDIELFCADHNTLCCVMCVATEHRRCDKVASIDKLAKQLEEGAVTEELVDKLNSYLDHLKTMKTDREWNKEKLIGKKEEIMEQIANYKENVNILLEKLESTLSQQFERVHAKETDRLNTEIDWCTATQSAVENAKTVLLVTNRHCSNAQVFITVQQCIERSIRYEDEIAKEQNEKFELLDYSFEIDSAFEAFLQSLISVETFGNVHTHRRRAFIPSSPGLKLLRDRTAEPEIEFDAKTPSDTRNCCLSSVLFLSDKRILLADQNNQKIKLFKDNGSLVYEQAFTTWPRDFTELGNNKVAVTLPKERKIEIFYLGEKLKNLETIRMVDECWGITYSNNTVIVGCIGPDKGNIKLLTLDGVEIDTIEDDPSGRRLFIKTNYVTTNINGKEVYITDRTKDTVVALALKRNFNKQQVSEDQGPKRLLPVKPRHRSSTVLGHGRDQNTNFQAERRARSEMARNAHMVGDYSQVRENKVKESANSPLTVLDEAFDEKLEESYDARSKGSPQRDLKNLSGASLKTDDLDAVATRQSPIEREDTRSTISQINEHEEKVDYDVLYSYSNDILKSAGGIGVDHQGNIYVTGYRSSNVHQISPGGSLIKILLHNLSQPLAICTEPFGDRFAVTETTSHKQNLVQIFRLV
ncbi:tripartite motif-containing protein 2-like [Mercenaria mercenaria]|uniref:tripartite motif-containing protein 2-like n=1 Tax=Mercenaria mercenaria TaxID=6596 RepID=UPI00234E64BE|nr:tripartite motif-containing protein 2-like [Mercenaria mercenaria]